MYSKIIINLILVLLISSLRISSLPNLFGVLQNLNIVLVYLIFVLILDGLPVALWLAVSIGLVLDIFSFNFFGLNIIALALSLIFTNLLLIHFFTNRALLSFTVLIISLTVLYEFFLSFFGNRGGGASGYYFLKNQAEEIFLNLLLVFILFYIFNFLSRKFQPVFYRRYLKR
jgi:cell shape-determining protein MreD